VTYIYHQKVLYNGHVNVFAVVPVVS